MSSSPIATTAQRLRRAAELGRELRAIAADPGLHALSRDAWLMKCVELGSFETRARLEAARAVLRACPNLAHEVEIRARLWVRDNQDRPAVFRFADGDRFPAAYAEMLASKLTDEQMSAIAAFRTAELRLDETFGRLSDWSDLDALVDPKLIELAELDRVLATTLKLADLAWQTGRPVLIVGGLVVLVDEATVARVASAVADAAQLQIRDLAAA